MKKLWITLFIFIAFIGGLLLLTSNSNNSNKKIVKGSQVTIDFEGYIDGNKFQGGSAQNYELLIGSHSFIDNYEDQLIGHKIGDIVDVKVKFPDNYSEKTYAGKEATFKTKIKDIKSKNLIK